MLRSVGLLSALGLGMKAARQLSVTPLPRQAQVPLSSRGSAIKASNRRYLRSTLRGTNAIFLNGAGSKLVGRSSLSRHPEMVLPSSINDVV
jgi:hypothetical protein